MEKTAKKFLEKYLNTFSPVGFENPGQQVWLDYKKPYMDEVITDTYGTAVGVINPEKKYKVVIEAHADEISWFVNYVSKDGYIYVRRNGGSDFSIAPSMRVKLFGEKGPVDGVFGWPAIHTRHGKDEKSPQLDTIFLDCGASSAKEVEKMGIHVGCVVTYEDSFTTLNDKYFVGRAS